MIDQLIDIIAREANLFESFLRSLQQQQQMLVRGDMDGLNRVTAQQQELLEESRRLNDEREELIARIGEANAIEGDITVSRLLEVADADQAQRLQHLRDLILELHEQIERTRNSNAMLINQSRQIIADTMAELSRVHRPRPGYTVSGTAADDSRALVMDRRA